MNNKKRSIALAVALLVVLGFSARALLTRQTESPFKKKIVVLGMDALDPAIVERLIQAGKLPRFARLKGTGSYSRLSTTNPPQSPVAWAAFATGKNPGRNGVFDFIKRDPKTYGLELVFSGKNGKPPARILKEKGFWNYASEKKVPVVALSCPDTFPPDKVYGKMLSGMGVPDILGTQGTFVFYTSEPSRKDKSVGGKVIQIPKTPVVESELVGPRKARTGGKAQNVRVPFRLVLLDKEHARVEYQGRKTELAVGQWSDWRKVDFSLGFFRKARGIFKFYLVSTEPEIRLYVSPINFDPRHPFFPISYPKNYAGQLAKEIGLYYTQGMPMDTWALNENRLSEDAFLHQSEAVFKERREMFDLELGRFKGGILFCYFESIDIIQHMFWRYMDPEHPSYKKGAEQRDEIDRWYVKMDEVLGDAFAKLGPEDTLIVLSDHGFGSFRRAVHLNSWLREMGHLSLKKEIKNATDRELFEAVDWEKTQAYALGFGGIYINQRGRESRGTVDPGEETETLKNKIAEELEAWTDEPSEEPIVRKVYKREEIFHGPYAEEAPDLYVGFNPGYRASWQTAIGGAPAKRVENNLKKWSGDHLFDPTTVPGVIFSNRKILRRDPTIYDVAPSILKEAGFTDEEIQQKDFDGKPLF
ncbi:MAG: alkaline phosphatase family protein [Candidatus Omnitrophota bacterium]